MQLEGLFEIAPSKKSELAWDVSLPIEERDWNVGLVVGPSGCGKSTLARDVFGQHMVRGYDWPADRSVVDAFPSAMGIKEITALLSSVGFSSPPAWLRPFGVLSNGEQFRVTMARAMAEGGEMIVVDEFTSVVDRQVAQIGSAAIAKAVRVRGQRFVAVTCHFDVIDWLQPDWVFDPSSGQFDWRELRRRPEIKLEVVRVHRSAWNLFKHHHYLDRNIHPAANCFAGLVEGRPAAFSAVLSFPHPKRPGWREHRTVCLPDFQGVGIGNRLSEFVAAMYRATGKPYFSTTANPAMVRYRARSPLWRMTRPPGRNSRSSSRTCSASLSAATRRYTSSFEFVGPALPEQALGFGVI
jgi:ABC-type ATPase involved in cell division